MTDPADAYYFDDTGSDVGLMAEGPTLTEADAANLDKGADLYNSQFGGWVTEWSTDFPLVGVTPNLSGLELWFGSENVKMAAVQYPMQAMAGLLAFIVEGDRDQVTGTGLHLAAIPAGWLKIDSLQPLYP